MVIKICIKSFKGLFLILLLSIILASSTFASYGKISGRVYDKNSGDPLPGANIIIESFVEHGRTVEIREKQGASADEDGYYFILNVRPGNYNVRASMIGYTPLIKQKVRVNIDRTIFLDFTLESSVLEMQAVEVTAEREIIKPDVSGTQEIITTERITETPVLRVDEFVNKIKGVELVADNDGHGLSIRGGNIRETDIRIDGISARDPRSENAYMSLNASSVEELQVLTGGFEAKYGGFRSGLVNVMTKEGSPNKYSVTFSVDFTPKSEYKFFGDNPWSKDSWIYKVFADTNFTYFNASDSTYRSFAIYGVPKVDSLIPEGFPDDLKSFRGWKKRTEGIQNYEALGLPRRLKLTPEQKRKLWVLQHPLYEYANKPDVYMEGTITGPVPGKWIPILGNFIGKSTFLLAGKYENSQFTFPIGPRQDYTDWNTQLKITSKITSNTKLATNLLYAKVKTNTANRPSTLGGALMDYSSRFSFLSSTQRSSEQQARILGSGNGFINMFNKSRLQYLDQNWILGGMKFNHAISRRTFYTIDFQFTYQDNEINPFSADTSRDDMWAMVDSFRVLLYPKIGTPNGSTNPMNDITNLFLIYGGVQQADSSFSWTASLRWDLTTQLGRYHLLETGFDLRYIFSKINSGTWYQSEKLFTPGVPDTWQYYTINPVEVGLYLQDKLEFQGMIARVGLRADYFNPNKKYYLVENPLDKDYANLYNLEYEYLSGKWGSWERWETFRDMLDDPPGWPAKQNKKQIKFSPRLGVSFPITINSKLYFNYGHFYQRPSMTFLYNLAITADEVVVPSPDLDMAKTVQYEFGYEQRLLKDFLLNVTLYYKNVTDEPLSRTFIDYWQEFSASKYFPDSFADTRGLELRIERNIGKFLTFWGNYEYMLQSWGQTGLKYNYENRVIAKDEERVPNVTTTEPRPRAYFNINLHTPKKWGVNILGLRPMGGIYCNLLLDWKDMGKIVIESDPLTGKQKRADIVNYLNIDLRASKKINISGTNIEVVLTVTNILNQKRLYTGGMSSSQYNKYRESLCFPWEEGEYKGDDEWGEYREFDVALDPLESLIDNPDSDPEIAAQNDEIIERNNRRRDTNSYIDTGWFTAPLFLNPRRVVFGIRINF